MSTATRDNSSTLASRQGVLRALRTLAIEPSESLTDLLQATDKQVGLLRNLLPGSPENILAQLTRLIPSIMIEHVDSMPVPGVSFWGNGSWKIHIRASDRLDVQVFAGLHELKHIIDHPLRRRQPDLLKAGGWEGLADYLAAGVVSWEPNNSTGNRGSPSREHTLHQSITRMGGLL